MNPKRVLIGGFTQHTGGMEIYIMEIYRHIDRDKVQFDFLNIGYDKLAFEDEIIRLGGRIIELPTIAADNKKRKTVLKKLFASKEYVAVYFQFNRKPVNYDIFKIAKANGVRKCIIHSHNSQDDVKSIAYKILSKVNKPFVYKYVDTRFACSRQAGKFMFGKLDYKVINNCVNTERFKYDESSRAEIREELGIPKNAYVFGTVARLAEVKNPKYLIEVFKEVQKKDENMYMVHVGEGELYDEIKEEIKQSGIEDKFMLLGRRSDINKILSALDEFVLPSYYEGFPISLVEAQCSGLPCIASTNVTTDCNITGMISYVSLDDVDGWVKQLLTDKEKDREYRKDAFNVVKEKEYDLMQLSKSMEEMFYQL